MVFIFHHCPENRFELSDSPVRDCSEIGKISLGNEPECQEAALALGLYYVWWVDASWNHVPKGCFIDGNRDAYWNAHETGASSENHFPICKKDGNHYH